MSFDASAVRHVDENMADGYVGRFGDDLEQSLVDGSVLQDGVDILQPSALVLDLGCGPGQVASYFVARGCRAVGVDLTPSAPSTTAWTCVTWTALASAAPS